MINGTKEATVEERFRAPGLETVLLLYNEI